MTLHIRHGALAATTLAVLFSSVASVAQIATPRSPAGPFYPLESMRFADQDLDLVQIQGRAQVAQGDVVFLTGIVYDRQGNPAPGARVEIWQTDANARYLHTGDQADRPRDPNFQGFGASVADASGRYVFRTIKPQAYPGRTPHIHLKAFHQGQELTSQFFIADDSGNANDGLWRAMNNTQREAVTMRFVPGAQGEQASVDIRF